MRLNQLLALSLAWMGILVLPLPLRGQSAETNDAEHSVMRRFAQQMLNLQSMRAQITCTVDNQQTGLKSDFTALLETRGKSFFLQGMGMEIYSDGTTRWQYLPDAREVTISSVLPSTSNPLEQPLEIFRNYEEHFKVRFRGERVEGGETYYDFSLYPHTLDTPFSQIHLTIAKRGLTPHRITYQGKDGVNYLLDIRQFTPNAKVRPSFQFDSSQHKGLEVIDLR